MATANRSRAPRDDSQRRGNTESDAGDGQRLIVGLQPVREAVKAHGPRMGPLWLLGGSPKHDALARYAEAQGVSPVTRLGRAELDRRARGLQHQGAVAFAPALALGSASDLLGAPDLLAVALDGIQDPQNFGAVIRSAVGLADAWVVWAENSSAPLSPATFRAAAGAVEHAHLCRVPSLRSLLQEAPAHGAQVVGLDAQAPQLLSDLNLTRPTLFVIGSEGAGMGRSIRRACGSLARISATHKIDSLNASVAAALALYEALRQRRRLSTAP